MPIIRRPKPHERNHFARGFVDSAQRLGEQIIALKMFKSSDPNNSSRQKSEHWDEVYQQVDYFDRENNDYGNVFNGGVDQAYRIWSIWNESTDGEQYSKRGEFLAEKREVQTEPWPELVQHDYLIRVKRWSPTGVPLELHPFRYVITTPVTDATVHTGGQLSQTDADRWGQRFSVSALPENHPIYEYSVDLTQPFPRRTYPPYST
jgi:hypothetical protein